MGQLIVHLYLGKIPVFFTCIKCICPCQFRALNTITIMNTDNWNAVKNISLSVDCPCKCDLGAMRSPFIMMNWNIVVISSCRCHTSQAKTQTKECYRYTYQLNSAQNRLNNKRLIICDRAHMVFLAWWTALFQPTWHSFLIISPPL